MQKEINVAFTIFWFENEYSKLKFSNIFSPKPQRNGDTVKIGCRGAS
jgi:hypothetical protein